VRRAAKRKTLFIIRPSRAAAPLISEYAAAHADARVERRGSSQTGGRESARVRPKEKAAAWFGTKRRVGREPSKSAHHMVGEAHPNTAPTRQRDPAVTTAGKAPANDDTGPEKWGFWAC
jgi:hypothetical protein